ncbi:hypothetical protein HRI_004126400 [Hibiscus trionum]|uniref:Retrotransposon Copia-like N-terminal domain-containing protein n=1 Tax=Hibiscus trionum TaxID=183268 RepID=A0A9W7ML58_HIBTR|nr:hypothetical protein HRI_004126400 [Hibiscus trionum]
MVSAVSSSTMSSSKHFTNKIITIRLDESNFLLWKQQILFAIESLRLVSHVDGTISIPAQVVVIEKGERVLNLDYAFYKQEDSALCSRLLSSIIPSILSSLVGCKTALDIWEKLQQAFFNFFNYQAHAFALLFEKSKEKGSKYE